MFLKEIPYDREKATAYANKWAYRRNPNFYDFSEIGGDCTNFASQCLFEGCRVMNFTPTYGWYYIDVDNRAPAWTSVKYFYRFLTENEGPGPFGENADISMVELADFVQIRFIGREDFSHTPIITEIVGGERTLDTIKVAAHSNDVNCRPLSTYRNVAEYRYIHILGARYLEQS